MDLSGAWRAAKPTPESDRAGADLDFDDSGWDTVTVPGHWGESTAFAYSTGPLLYRKPFSHPAPVGDTRHWLTLEGVIADSDVWLDGNFLGSTTGYFVTHRFEITEALAARTDHILAIQVSCPEPEADQPKHALTGSLQSGPLAPAGSPGGIWRPVSIDSTGTIAIRHSRILCTRASTASADLHIRLVIDSAEAGDIRIDTSVAGSDGVAVAGGSDLHTVAAGENRIEWSTRVMKPRLWWPHSLGDQPLYEVGVAIRGEDSEVSDRRHWRTGLRTVSVEDLQFKVNGRKLFTKGISIGPQDRFLGSVNPAVIGQDVRAAAAAGLDLIRVHGHIGRPELYTAADEAGMLVWQDLPLVGVHSTRARKSARVVARSAVDELGAHPSVAVWCGHDEPNGPPIPPPGRATEATSRLAKRLARHLAPSWNRSYLGPLIRRELKTSDPTRSVIAQSGGLPRPSDMLVGSSAATDPHLWVGWFTGSHTDLGEMIRRWPRLGRFLGGFGSQSVDVREWPEDAPNWPGAQKSSFARYLPRKAYGDGISWSHATRAYQADLLRHQIETVRRLKYSPTTGFCLMALVDAAPEGGFGLFDSQRRPKPALNAVADACRPVVVIADSPPRLVSAGERLELSVHAVNDLRRELGTVSVTARARCGDWHFSKTWEGPTEADSVQHVGDFVFDVPLRTGTLIVDLDLQAEGVAATNRYQTVVIPAAEATTSSHAS